MFSNYWLWLVMMMMMMKRNGENRARNEAMMSFFGVLSIAAKGSTRREEEEATKSRIWEETGADVRFRLKYVYTQTQTHENTRVGKIHTYHPHSDGGTLQQLICLVDYFYLPLPALSNHQILLYKIAVLLKLHSRFPLVFFPFFSA